MLRFFRNVLFLCLGVVLTSCGSSEVVQKKGTTSQNATSSASSTLNETDEQRAVRIAEHFIAINGYTTAEPDRNNLTPETIEYGLEERRNSLQPKAYGLVRKSKGKKPGWTVVFLYTKEYGSQVTEKGRAVMMDENFENLRVEHVDFLLKHVDVKF